MFYLFRRCVPLGVLPRLGVVALFAFVLTGCGGGDSPAPSGPAPPPPAPPPPPVDSRPLDVAITPDGAFAYVTNIDSGTVFVIETANNTVVATVGWAGRPGGAFVSPDQERRFPLLRGRPCLHRTCDARNNAAPSRS